jgi:anti-sigma regulatory factor (Ser/Thr protein kinase)
MMPLQLWEVSKISTQTMPSKTFAGQYSSLAAIADFFAQAADEAGFDSKDTYAIKLAVDEACSNIIEHGYGEAKGTQIRCSYEILPRGIKIIIQDWGKPFKPEDIPDPNFNVDLCDLEPRGAGLYFMRKLMDKVEFDFESGDGNILIMVKRK